MILFDRLINYFIILPETFIIFEQSNQQQWKEERTKIRTIQSTSKNECNILEKWCTYKREKKKWENVKPYYRIRKKKNSKDIMELCIVECLYIKEYLQYE